MPETLTVAIVGCGIGRAHITEGYLADPERYRVVAVCDLDNARLDAFAEEFGIPRKTTIFDDLLAMDDVDIIDVCTPPSVHYAQILAALAAGKHVICEKPLVGSLKEVDEVIAAERNAKGKLMPIFQYRYGDGVQKAKKIIDSGVAGMPYVGTAETFWQRLPEYYAVPWRGKWATELGGVLMTHAIHIHDMLMWLMGRPAGLFGRVATRVHAIEVEDCVSASLELESGALASMTATLGSREELSRLHLAFENVTFESSHFPYALGNDPWRIVPRDDKVKAEIDALLADWTPVPPRFAGQMRDFHRALTQGTPLPVTTADARSALELVAAFYHSARTRQDVRFPLGPGHPLYEGWIPGRPQPRSA
ncbi:Gfo/Idh/MocA family protein [Chelativorans xinjiangense]|uniref:Gfo/Idh/MocA family protein n=1 Tax=Chelativorans xinjiangense TaxID=2681485 RepID=UPI00135A5DDB|nr:Gfo/Idh/MocA family oxidoreductase [Chelativorans xinjiangense]